MAQLLAPNAPNSERISQILPTVKCSSCNRPVPISELGEHICAPPPAPASKPPMSPRSASFLAHKYQNVLSRSQTPPAQSPSAPAPRQPSPLIPHAARSPSTSQIQPLRTRTPSTTSTSSSLSVPARPQRTPSPSARDTSTGGGSVAFPSHPGPSSPLSMRHISQSTHSRSSMSSRSSSSSSQTTSPLSLRPSVPAVPRTSIQTTPSTNTPGLRARIPSNASVRSTAYSIRQPTQSSPTPYVPPSQPGPRSPDALSPTPRPRAITNAGAPPAFQTGPEVIYSTSNGPGAVFPPRASPSPAPSTSFAPGQLMPGQLMSPGPAPYSPPPAEDIDTKIGGEAGMAGVGRRGFAAAARAAMFAGMNNAMNIGRDDQSAVFANLNAIQSMDGRRANAPNYLDISAVSNYANTPPLTPNSGSPHSPHSPPLPSPTRDSGRQSITPTRPAIASRTPSPNGPGRPFMQGDRVIPPAPEPPKDPLPATPTTPVRLPFFEKFKNKHSPVDLSCAEEEDPSPLSPTGSESSFGGLAYADSDEEEEDKPPISAPAGLSSSPMDGAVPALPPKSVGAEKNRVRFPSVSSKTESVYPDEEDSSSSAASTVLPKRSLSQSTVTSAYSVRSAAKSTGALDHAMETLFEEDAASPTATSASSPAMFGGLGESHRDSKPPKLPTRSHTSPILSGGRPDSKHSPGKRRPPKIRSCVKCSKQIDDGRWIQMDGGSVLCDKCWKNMYLPKCRRCNKIIEKAAVSSSDGQLKGKYHRECFTCYTCSKPFPDKSFYVFDGKPFCAYHYHEANDSLCAATTCGQPIEGPCAVSHSGDRYHPEHFLCEWSRCNERLLEYWEVDGRMLCEKHGQLAMKEGEIQDKDPLDGLLEKDERRDSIAFAKATKRVTRFIDLASLNANNGGGSDDADESDLR